MPYIEVRDLAFTYQGAKDKVLDGISFDIEAGEIITLFGLSGSGKSTLCQILCGIIPRMTEGELTGSVKIGGEDIAPKPMNEIAERIGFVMQDPDRQIIAPTVEEEIAFGPENLMLPREEIEMRVGEVLHLLGIEDLRDKNPLKLSGGQKQIVAIASVLAMKPETLVLDEPMSHLDEDARVIIRETIQRLRDDGRTVIVVEHDYHTMDFADRWLHIRDGKVASFALPGQGGVEL